MHFRSGRFAEIYVPLEGKIVMPRSRSPGKGSASGEKETEQVGRQTPNENLRQGTCRGHQQGKSQDEEFRAGKRVY
jgi:hypothetical protein